MADESIVIEIKDGVDNGIAAKIRLIGVEAKLSQQSLNDLSKQLKDLNVSNLRNVNTQVISASAAITKLDIANQNLATAQQRTTAATAAATAANTKAATAAVALATEQARLSRAQDQAAQAALRLANAQAQANKPSASDAFLSSLKKQSEAIGKTQADLLELRAAQLGVTNAAAPFIAKLREQEKGLNAAGMSAKAYNAAMRGVPAQITDIVVSLQGGQRPFTVLLQQGGQLKDMFGGIGPAAKALGTGLLKLINPTTLLIAGFAAFAYAVGNAESKLRELNGMLAQFTATGRGDIDSSFIKNLRTELQLLPGISRSVATEVIKAFADVRSVGGGILKEASLTVADLATAMGTTAPKAAVKLAEALNDPIKGAEDLDKSLGFLTVSDFKAIDALSKLGKTAEAQQYLLDKLKLAVDGLAEDSLTPLQKATNNLGNSWSNLLTKFDSSEGLRGASELLGKLVNLITILVDKLASLSDWKPPSWMQSMMDNGPNSWLGVQGLFGGKTEQTGGASGSWQAPKGAQYGQTTDYKMRAAGLKGPKDTSGEKRSVALQKLNLQLDNEIKLLGIVGQAREKEEMFDRIQEGLVGRKIKLNDEETKSIREKIDAIVQGRAVQAEMNRINEEANGALLRYNATDSATQKLLADGIITDTRAQREFIKNAEMYDNAIDPMREYRKELEQRLALTKLLPDAMEVESQIQQLQNTLLKEGIVLTGSQTQAERDRLTTIQQSQKYQDAYNAIYNQTSGALKQLTIDTVALTQAHNNGLISAEQYGIRMNQLAVDASNLKLQMGTADFADGFLSSIGRITEGYHGMLSGLSTSFGDFFVTLENGFADSIGNAIVNSENLGDALKNVAKQGVSALISSLVKLGIQYGVNALLGQSIGAAALATQTSASVAAAGITATAWAPAAALASLASFGANAVPAAAGITATAALSEGIALSSLLGFETGGYTGNGGRSSVAGVVHGQEFVMNAQATSRIGVQNLEAMQSGALSVGTNSAVGKTGSSAAGGISIEYVNNGTPQTIETEQISEDRIRIISQDVANKQISKQVPDLVSGQIRRPNSKISKSIESGTNAQRKRP